MTKIIEKRAKLRECDMCKTLFEYYYDDVVCKPEFTRFPIGSCVGVFEPETNHINCPVCALKIVVDHFIVPGAVHIEGLVKK